jgi:hypothetical protein
MRQLVDDLNCNIIVGHFGIGHGTNTNINSYIQIYPVGLLADRALQSLKTKSDPKFTLKSYLVPLSIL